jgi:hypothetical protein
MIKKAKFVTFPTLSPPSLSPCHYYLHQAMSKIGDRIPILLISLEEIVTG